MTPRSPSLPTMRTLNLPRTPLLPAALLAAVTCSLGWSLAAGHDDRSLKEVERDLQLRPDDLDLLLEAADAAFADDDDRSEERRVGKECC